MSTAVAVWSVRVEPGKKTKFVAQSDIRITGAALDATLADQNARSSIKFTYETPQRIDEDEDEEEEDETPPATMSTILCSLTPGKIEQASLDLIVSEEDEIEFEIIGKNAIHLSGNYISQQTDFPADDDSDFDDEDGYDLRDVSSDVEVDPAELDVLSDSEDGDDSHRFEEVTDEPASTASKKRPRDSDAMEVEGGEAKTSKKQQKKLNKKLKAEDGKAVPNGGSKEEEPKEAKKGEKKEKKEEKKEKKKDDKEASKKQSEVKDLPSGLKVKDVKAGTGKAAKKGDLVSMRYIGKFTDGKIFDSNTKGKPFTFKLGAGEVIKGWDEGIVGMQSGGERLLVVPPKMGYGSRKIDGIPANSTLKFECKLLEIKN
ncbi:hypothetical protein M0805_001668 [Coniferiporia weirii]|nr:hypothetical protein M0805_001668 [Coniferiporia weirii]